MGREFTHTPRTHSSTQLFNGSWFLYIIKINNIILYAFKGLGFYIYSNVILGGALNQIHSLIYRHRIFDFACGQVIIIQISN